MAETLFKDIAFGRAFNGFFVKKLPYQKIFLSLIDHYYAKNKVFVGTIMRVGTAKPLFGVSKITQKYLSFSIFLLGLVFWHAFWKVLRQS